MALHTAETADWESIPAKRRNVWQKLAAKTGGIITPANFISLAGLGVVFGGLALIIADEIGYGLIFVLLGRLADLADGYVADLTKTKSPLGEAVDAAVDKIALGLTAITLVATAIIPPVVAILMLSHVGYNAVLVSLATRRQIRPHPSKAGKYGAAAAWLAIILFIASAQTSFWFDDIVRSWAIVWFAVFVILSVYSSWKYTSQVRGARRVSQK